MVHRVFNSAQYLLVNVHHVVNGGQYVNQMARSVDYSAYLVNTALESKLFNYMSYRVETCTHQAASITNGKKLYDKNTKKNKVMEYCYRQGG